MANEKRLIDVNKVIDSMQKCLDEAPDKKDSVAYFAFESIITALKQEPTVDAVEVVHGRWITEKCDHVPWRIKNPEKWVIHKCSVCGYSNGRKHSNYCPSCGADMR